MTVAHPKSELSGIEEQVLKFVPRLWERLSPIVVVDQGDPHTMYSIDHCDARQQDRRYGTTSARRVERPLNEGGRQPSWYGVSIFYQGQHHPVDIFPSGDTSFASMGAGLEDRETFIFNYFFRMNEEGGRRIHTATKRFLEKIIQKLELPPETLSQEDAQCCAAIMKFKFSSIEAGFYLFLDFFDMYLAERERVAQTYRRSR